MRRKVLLVTILVIAILLQCVMPFVTVNAASSVVITLNSNLYKAVKAQLQEQRITAEYKDANGIIIISQTELNRVTKLNLENSEIDDLTGLEAFSKVTDLNLHANKLTADSNLQVIDSLSLTDLDLSSNQLESVKSITSFGRISRSDITDQRVTLREIISVDDSEEAESHPTQITVTLPDILLEDGNQVNPAWLVNNLGNPNRTILSYTDPVTGVTTYPEIDFANSFGAGSTDLVINIASGTAANYHALKGLIKFEIKVNDSTSKLANTQMTFYYAIVNEDETGITFDDENLYKAVKEQLTLGQKVNSELYETTGSFDASGNLIASPNNRNIYSRPASETDTLYDEALILVIDTDDVVNNIPSLILNDKKIKDLKGLEEFVGLESKLDISYNYITTVKRIVELEENKIIKEQEIRDKYKKVLDELKTNVAAYDRELANIEAAQENYNRAATELAGITDPNAIVAKRNEMQGYLDQKAAAEDAAARYLTLVNKYVAKLYKIYEKEYKLVTLLPSEVNYLSYDKLFEADLDTVKDYANKIMTRVASLEKASSLTTYENWAIRKLMTNWATSNGSTFKTEKTVYTVNPSDPTHPIETTEPIKYPISEFFDEVKADGTLDITDFEEFVYIFKCIDALSQVENYSLIKRTFEGTTSTYAEEALEDVLKLYEQKDYDPYFYNLIAYNASVAAASLSTGTAGAGYEINQPSGLFPVQIGLASSEYSGAVPANYKTLLAHRQSLVTDDDITTYITLPRVQKLNIADNKTRTLEGLEALTELKELNAWKNLVNNISNVDWTKFEKLKVLNLGYNQISDINDLQDLLTLEELDVSYNLLAGRFTFRLLNMKNLKVADFSHNQYNDIQYAHDQFILKALGYDADGDGVAEGYTVPEYLEAAGITLSFQYQTLEMSTTIVKTGDEFVEFELPLIFRQLESMDNARTSFGIDSIGGLVEPEGTTVKLRVPAIGTYQSVVSVEGRNGTAYSYDGIGYGTTCTIKYTVVDGSSIPVTPTPVNPSDPTAPQYGYTVEDGYVYIYKPGTTLTEFTGRLADSENYNVSVTENRSTSKIGTGAVVTVTSKDDNTVYSILEVVVKGDINGDGEVDALDSGIIRSIINDTAVTTGVFASAADVNNDGDIDSQDAMLILQYRADRISSFED